MPNYILTVNIETLFDDPAIDIWFFERDDWDLKEIMPWLDPTKGRVQRCIQSVQCRQRTARSALIAVEALTEFPEFLESQELPIELEEANGRILIDVEGRLYHIGAEKITELTGQFTHETFHMVPNEPIPDLQAELSKRAARYIEDKMDEELAPLGCSPEPALFPESIDEAMRDLDDLVTVTFEQLDLCAEKALQILGKKHFGED